MTLNIRGFVPLIQVYDMPQAIGFYRDILGFEVLSQSSQGEDFDWAMLGHAEWLPLVRFISAKGLPAGDAENAPQSLRGTATLVK